MASSHRPRQTKASSEIIFDTKCKGRILVGDRTGSSNSLILQTVVVCVGGITLIIVPLLPLTANQLSSLDALVRRDLIPEMG